MPDPHEADLVPSPGGWDAPPNGMQVAPERMPWWVRAGRRIPFLDRFARDYMWSHGGYLVLPPDHPLLGLYSPEEYEALTGISRAEYERRCLAAAREAFAEVADRFVDAEIAIEGDELITQFRIEGRSERFGSRIQLWPSPHPDDYEGEPEWSDALPEMLEAGIEGRSRRTRKPDADGVTWLDR